jgi:hypothetical protein
MASWRDGCRPIADWVREHLKNGPGSKITNARWSDDREGFSALRVCPDEFQSDIVWGFFYTIPYNK